MRSYGGSYGSSSNYGGDYQASDMYNAGGSSSYGGQAQGGGSYGGYSGEAYNVPQGSYGDYGATDYSAAQNTTGYAAAQNTGGRLLAGAVSHKKHKTLNTEHNTNNIHHKGWATRASSLAAAPPLLQSLEHSPDDDVLSCLAVSLQASTPRRFELVWRLVVLAGYGAYGAGTDYGTNNGESYGGGVGGGYGSSSYAASDTYGNIPATGDGLDLSIAGLYSNTLGGNAGRSLDLQVSPHLLHST